MPGIRWSVMSSATSCCSSKRNASSPELRRDDVVIAAEKPFEQAQVGRLVVNDHNFVRHVTRCLLVFVDALTEASASPSVRSAPSGRLASMGSVTVKVVPEPWRLSTLIVPPWRSTMP